MSSPSRLLVLLLLVPLAMACGERAPHEEAASRAAALAQEADAARVGFPVEVRNDHGMRFRLLPTGVFAMGTAEDEPGHRADETQHDVHFVTPTYLQTHEVTNAQYRRFRPDHDSGRSEDGVSLDGDGQPVVNVTRADAIAYAAWLREQDPRWRYRLPTEAEWEWACRLGGHASPRCDARATGVGTADAWGLFDLCGGVREWCHDRYGAYPAWKQDNPQGATTGAEFVARGASWRDRPADAHCARRSHHVPDHASSELGFRLAMSLGYGRHAYGRHVVTFQTVDPTVSEGEDALRPGYALRMISVVDRLTDRQNRPSERPFWTELPGRSPRRVHLAPGRYYVYAYRRDGDDVVRGIEVKFDVPDRDVLDVPVPRPDQVAPQ